MVGFLLNELSHPARVGTVYQVLPVFGPTPEAQRNEALQSCQLGQQQTLVDELGPWEPVL